MKRYKNLVIGGIQNKVFNLILFTVVLLTAAFMAISIYQNHMLTDLAEESGKRQQESIGEITGELMTQVVAKSLERSNRMEADIVNSMFEEEAQRVTFLADLAEKLFASPEDYDPHPYAGPDPADDGTWTAKVIYADGVDPQDPAIVSKLGLIANLSETMISLCSATRAEAVYIGLPEGVHLTVSDTASGWMTGEEARSYDPRSRGWYQKAVDKGGLIFYDKEQDIDTGAYCIECAMPVFGPEGRLEAVVGTDLFLDEMQEVLLGMALEGEHFLLVNEEGLAVPGPQAEDFPLNHESLAGDLRTSENPILSQAVSDAEAGKKCKTILADLSDGSYYITASPISSTGWALVSAFSEELAMQPIGLLQESNAKIQEDASSVYRDRTKKSRSTALVLLLIVMALTLTGGLVLGKRIVKPLNTITRRIARLSENNLEFKMEDAYRTGDEVQELAEAFAAISHRTVVYMDRIVKVTAEKERIGAELSLATDIQAAMLPHIFPAFPERNEFDIYASMDPAKEVGGDFYDYFLIDEDHLCMVMADVSGKGVPAALFMMASKIILQSVAMLGYSPAEILARTNETICSNNEAQMFVTVWLGILELSTGKLTAANAGHEFPVLKQAKGGFALYRDKHGFVIGGMEGIHYKEYEIRMEPGSKLFVYTDGVPEATNACQELFGTERMLEALNVNPDAAPEQILSNVRAGVDGFVQDAEQFDDLTMLCLEYKG